MSAEPTLMIVPFFQTDRGPINLEDLESQRKHLAVLIPSSEVAFHSASDFYAQSAHTLKEIDFVRKRRNQPHQDKINEINDEARVFTDILKEIQQIAKQKCEAYQKMLEERKAEEQKNIEEAREIFGIENDLASPHLPPVLRAKGATLFTRTVRKFRIVDSSKIPSKYLKVDEEAITQDIKLGIQEIPGLEIYEEKVSQMRSRS